MILTTGTSMIFSVCIQIFVVSSMFLQRVINESSMKKHWNINVTEFNTSRTRKIEKVFFETITVSNIPLQRIIKDHRRSSNGTSMFRRLSQQKKLSLMPASKSSMSHQRLFKESSTTINQSSSNETSKFEILHMKSSIDQKHIRPNIRSVINGSSKCHQRIIKEEPVKNQWLRC